MLATFADTPTLVPPETDVVTVPLVVAVNVTLALLGVPL